MKQVTCGAPLLSPTSASDCTSRFARTRILGDEHAAKQLGNIHTTTTKKIKKACWLHTKTVAAKVFHEPLTLHLQVIFTFFRLSCSLSDLPRWCQSILQTIWHRLPRVTRLQIALQIEGALSIGPSIFLAFHLQM